MPESSQSTGGRTTSLSVPAPGEDIGTQVRRRLVSIPPLGWLMIITALCLLPFINKAFQTDDTLFLRAAQQIQKHPLDFYGFNINWFGYTSTMVEAFENPPLTCYFIALAASIVGWSEPALHLAFMLPALAAVWGVYRLAQFHCRRPFVAGLIAALSPVFLISAASVMCDVMLLALWVWSVVWFERGLQNKHRTAFIVSGCLVGLAVLNKFPGLALVPLLTAYGILRLRRPGWWLLAPVIPLLFAALFEAVTYKLYGRGLILFAANYASGYRSTQYDFHLDKLIITVCFVGGSFLSVALFSVKLWSRRALLAAPCMITACLLFLPTITLLYRWMWPDNQSLSWVFFLQCALLFVAGVHVFLLAAADLWQRRDAVSVMLLLWIAGLFVFTSLVNWTVNARSLLSAVPAVAILVARRFDVRFPGAEINWKALWPAIPACLAALYLSKGDFDFANAQRSAAKVLGPKYAKPGRTLWFYGHGGIQYYFEAQGAKAWEVYAPQAVPGDILVLPYATKPYYQNVEKPFRLLDWISYPMPTGCSTMSFDAGAGFYAAVIGPLPFAVDNVQPEVFCVYEVLKPLPTLPEPARPIKRQ